MTQPDFDPSFATGAEMAREYRRLGIQVVPSWGPNEVPKGSSYKRPKLQTWTDLHEKLAPDFTFERWYGENGEHVGRDNMGMITGACSENRFVIDLDIHKNPAAQQWWAGLIALENNNIDPITWEQITGGGGIQKVFKAPPGFRVPTNRTSRGVDIRGQAGFAMLPSSVHESGKRYAWKPGQAPWDIECADAPQWLLEAILDLVEHYGGEAGAQGPTERTASPEQDYTAFGSRQDGRETEMFRAVWREVLEWYREAPIEPPIGSWQQRAEDAYERYELRVVSRLPGDKRAGLESEGRGPSAWWRKWQREMRHWGSPKMQREAARPNPRGENESAHNWEADFEQAAEQAEQKAKADPSSLYERLDVAQIKALADPFWLVDGLVIDQAMGFIYGPPGCLKTFIGLDMALSLATKQLSWWGRQVQRSGAVIYISSEGQGDLKFRITAWERHRSVDANACPFRLIRQSINFMSADDVGKLLATVQAVADETNEKIAAVFVDTVSRVLPGADENLQKDMTKFVAACDAVRQRFACTVVGIHHTARAGNMRGSTVMPGAGDFVVEVRREPGVMHGSIYAWKIKAAQDGWEQFFKVEEVQLGDIQGRTSLVLDATEKMAADDQGDGTLPERAVCVQILSAIDEEWRKNRPWCFAKNSSRNATKNIMLRWHLERKAVDRLLAHWVAQGIIAEEICDPKNHIKGYCKFQDL